MNYYIVVEGNTTERNVYPVWISYINPDLTEVFSLGEIQNNNYIVRSGGGHPQYYTMISNAMADMNRYPNIDRLVVVADSEDLSHEKRREKIKKHIETVGTLPNSKIEIIIQDAAIESWALANQVILVRNPDDADLRAFIRHFDVSRDDPQTIPDYPAKELNRAQFATAYLKRALREKYRNLSYTKSNPEVLQDKKYFDRIVQRYRQTAHISCFGDFLRVFETST